MVGRGITALLLIAAAFAGSDAQADVCSGCSCEGGPGFRLPNGHCSSWKQHEAACNGACYPPGTVDDRPAAARIINTDEGKRP